jgi:ankyrin repeat protein
MGLGDVVKDLLEKGADKYIAGKDGKTALDIAEEKDLAYITMLLKK